MKARMWSMATTLGVVVMAGAWTAAAQAQQPARGTITLATVGGDCRPTVVGNDGDNDRIRARRGVTIQWTVINNCAAPSAVTLTDWVRKSDRAAAYPGDPNGRLNCNAAAGGRCTLTVVVKKDAETTTYSYTVSLNGLLLDPDVIIDP